MLFGGLGVLPCGAYECCLDGDAVPCLGDGLGTRPWEVNVHHLAVLLGPSLDELLHCGPGLQANALGLFFPYRLAVSRAECKAYALVTYAQVSAVLVAEALGAHFASILA